MATDERGVEIPTATEAREIALRFINSHFNNPDRDRPRISIPVDRKRDDDVRLCAFIKWAGEIEAVLRAAGEAEEAEDADDASDALWAKAREVAGKAPREGVSEKTDQRRIDTQPAPAMECERVYAINDETGAEDPRGIPVKCTRPALRLDPEDGKHVCAECLTLPPPLPFEDEPARGDEVRRGS